MSKGKIIAIVIAAIMLLYSFVAIGLYIMIAYFAPEKNTFITVNSGELANVTNEDEKWIINVEYYSNHNNTGVEMFEVKFNYYMSDLELKSDDPSVYSKGIQIVGDKEGSIIFEGNFTDVDFRSVLNVIGVGKGIAYLTYTPNQNQYFYDLNNEFGFASVDKLDEESKFQISIGSEENAENYLMKFLGKSTILARDENAQLVELKKVFTNYDVYENFDVNHFLAKILAVCRQNNQGYGADGKGTEDLGNIFAYQGYKDGAYTGDWLTSEKLINNKLIKNFTNYFTIRIKTHENGATKASDSMFGMIQGKQNFEILGSSLADNYFHGEQVITLTEKDFDYYRLSLTGDYQIKFSQELVEKISNKRNTSINILIDENALKSKGIYLTKNSNSGIMFKDELYYSIASRISVVKLQYTNLDNTVTITEVRI